MLHMCFLPYVFDLLFVFENLMKETSDLKDCGIKRQREPKSLSPYMEGSAWSEAVGLLCREALDFNCVKPLTF